MPVKSLLSFLYVMLFARLSDELPCSKEHALMQTTNSGHMNTLFKSWLALGDSYTIGESVSIHDRYTMQTIEFLKDSGIHFSDPEIIAKTGWTTGDLLGAIQNKKTLTPPYDIASILIGVNNQYQQLNIQEYKEEFVSLLMQAIQLTGNRPGHVLVISIPDYSITPFARDSDKKSISNQIDAFNKINQQEAMHAGVHYINVTGLSRMAANDPSLIASDGLHFSGKEYALWAKLLVPVINAIIK